ncbi:MAG: MBL fold metallo-hydrolase [Armatimonadota bacterium]
MSWETIAPDVWRHRDSCNVHAVRTAGGMLVVDAGTGAWLEALDELPARPAALACTHYFRDHSAGAVAAAAAGLAIWVPEYEEALFADPELHFGQRETHIVYDNIWDLYAPIDGVPVAGLLRDHDRPALGGVAVEVLPLGGATPTQVGLGVVMDDGCRVLFCGETIHSPGRIPRVAPLQYNYNDLLGAVQVLESLRLVRAWKPDLILPSLGEPIATDIDGALGALEENLHAAIALRPGETSMLPLLGDHPLVRITDHVWSDPDCSANTVYVISRSGKALALDYGYHWVNNRACSMVFEPERRRAKLHGLGALRRQFGIDRIDTVLVSHFHDDHVSGIPLLQRLHDTRCWAAENFADILEHPDASVFPCTWPQPIRVDRRLPLGEPFQWEEYTFHLHPMDGHTRFAALIGFEADGIRFAHTGDQYFFLNDGPYETRGRMQNHVYRNGATVRGYRQSRDWLAGFRPDIVLQGHQAPFHTDAAFFAQIAAWNDDYETLHRRLSPLGDDEIHFDLDAWGGWIAPYRNHVAVGNAITVTATLRNPMPRPARLRARLVGPPGWTGASVEVHADARAEVPVPLSIQPGGPCRRRAFAVELFVDDRPFGQVAEALATVGGERF